MAEKFLNLSPLASEKGFTIVNSSTNDDNLSYSVSNAGDINGDGIDDLVVGAPQTDPNGISNAGASYIIFGRSEGFPTTIDVSTLNGINGFSIFGTTESEALGRSVSAAGDVNGDGIDDLIVGSPFGDINNKENIGFSYVIFGKRSFSSTPIINPSTLNGSDGFRIRGLNAQDQLGYSVSNAGDINNDGFDDLIIGAPNAYTTNNGKPGQTYIVFGKSNFTNNFDLNSLDGNNGFVINGNRIEDYSGLSVSSAGDINNDGFDDLIIGAPQANPNGTNSGQAYIIYGKQEGFSASLNIDNLNINDGFIINGVEDSKFGFSVSNAGDVNGDGIDDIVIGAHDGDANGVINSGITYVIYGRNGNFNTNLDLTQIQLDGSNGFIINGINEFDNSGFAVSSIGDVNSDGIDDLLISANNADPNGASSGQSYVVFGQTNFTSSINLADIDGTNGFVINGKSAGNNLGVSVSGAGDINNDGIADFIISSPYASSSAGESYVIFGVNNAPTDLTLDNNIVDENIGNNAVIGQFTTVDQNSQVQTFTYTLDEGFGDNAAFTIEGNTLRINESPDFETKSSYTIRVTTTDQGGLSYQREFTININDVEETGDNENVAPNDLTLDITAINENLGDNAIVGQFTTTDENEGDTFTYTLDEGFGDNAAFTIEGNTLRINESPDFETKSNYTIRVTTTDQDGLSYQREFTININDVEETGDNGNVAPNDLTLDITAINENLGDNAIVGQFTTSDENEGDTFTYTLDEGFGDNAAFTIEGNTLRINESPDFETKSSYTIRVTTTDQDGLSYQREFTININDVEETGDNGNVAPNDLTLSITTVDENVEDNAVIGQFITTDENEGDTFTYSFNDNENYPDNAAFIIEGETLRIRQSPDFETKSSYNISVITTDLGGLSFTQQFTINVNDINDNDPNEGGGTGGNNGGGTLTTRLVKTGDDVFRIESNNETARLEVQLTGKNSNDVNEIAVFTVDNEQGTIDGINPGENGYTQAALNRSKIVFSTISKIPNQFDINDINKLLGFNQNDSLRFYLVRNGSTDSVQAGITPLSNVIIPDSSSLQITEVSANNFSLSWEYDNNNGRDFNDLVVEIKATDNPLPLGATLQDRPQGEIIDLRDVVGSVNAEFTVYREAAFDNYVGFYKVTDENGGIDVDGDGAADLLPGQAGYIQAAVNQHLSNFGLSVANGQTATFSGTLEGGAIYVPFLIANGRPDALLDNNSGNDPAIFFSYLGANSDGVDHVRLLGDNTFGFEDITGGGDNDFNDMIVQFNLQSIA